MIKLSNVSKTYPNKNKKLNALNNISLEIKKGEIIGILGRSGAGKSTLLRLINGLELPSQGQVLVSGQPVPYKDKPMLRKHRQSIGMVFQQANLLANLSVKDNIELPLTLADYKDHLNLASVMDFVDLADQKDKHPKQLSGGQQQRVGIARALITKPKILLCDEPTSALDEYTTLGIIDVIKKIRQSFQTTILVVTHELSVARQLCDRVAVLEEGELVDIIEVKSTNNPREKLTYLDYVRDQLGAGGHV